ncbi:hypothetical protein QUF76_04825 [Desulfobacterales bacterium HSG16]|nr:hypothetical protein [Desulfobacterales bacterium HSG16]
MKRSILIILTGYICFFYSCPAFSAYIIRLKNGTTFYTDTYWQEGSKIKFIYLTGTIGIKKEVIDNIIMADDKPVSKSKPEDQVFFIESIERPKPPPINPDAANKTGGSGKGKDPYGYIESLKKLTVLYKKASVMPKKEKFQLIMKLMKLKKTIMVKKHGKAYADVITKINIMGASLQKMMAEKK